MRSDQQQYQRTEVGTTTDEGAYDSNEEIADDPKPGALRRGCRVPHQGSRRVACLLRLTGEQDRARHDLQADRGRREKLASPRWPQLPNIILGVRFTDGIELVKPKAQAAAA